MLSLSGLGAGIGAGVGGGGAAQGIGSSLTGVAPSASGVNWASLLDRITTGITSPQGQQTMGMSLQALAAQQAQRSSLPQMQTLPQSPSMPGYYQAPINMIGWDQLAAAALNAQAPANTIPYIVAMGGGA